MLSGKSGQEKNTVVSGNAGDKKNLHRALNKIHG